MMNSSWNLDGDAEQYKTHAKAVAIDNTKPATGSYTGFNKGKPTGKATMGSGV